MVRSALRVVTNNSAQHLHFTDEETQTRAGRAWFCFGPTSAAASPPSRVPARDTTPARTSALLAPLAPGSLLCREQDAAISSHDHFVFSGQNFVKL